MCQHWYFCAVLTWVFWKATPEFWSVTEFSVRVYLVPHTCPYWSWRCFPESWREPWTARLPRLSAMQLKNLGWKGCLTPKNRFAFCSVSSFFNNVHEQRETASSFLSQLTRNNVHRSSGKLCSLCRGTQWEFLALANILLLFKEKERWKPSWTYIIPNKPAFTVVVLLQNIFHLLHVIWKDFVLVLLNEQHLQTQVKHEMKGLIDQLDAESINIRIHPQKRDV